MRQASTQNPAKRLRHKNTAPTHRSHHFYSVSFWLCRTCRKGWSLSIFCCILFFITIKFYKMKQTITLDVPKQLALICELLEITPQQVLQNFISVRIFKTASDKFFVSFASFCNKCITKRKAVFYQCLANNLR